MNYAVTLARPIPGVRSTIFGFDTEEQAYAFQRKIPVGSTVEPVGEAHEIIPPIFEVFATLRAKADDLRAERATYDLTTKSSLAEAIGNLLDAIEELGDYDEMLISNIKNALVKVDCHAMEDYEWRDVALLRHLAQPLSE